MNEEQKNKPTKCLPDINSKSLEEECNDRINNIYGKQLMKQKAINVKTGEEYTFEELNKIFNN